MKPFVTIAIDAARNSAVTECQSLDDVRRQIDSLDVRIVDLLTQRSHFVAQAAKFKESPQAVIVPERIDAIIAKVRGYAHEQGGDPDLIEEIYRRMIDAFISFEQEKWQDLNR